MSPAVRTLLIGLAVAAAAVSCVSVEEPEVAGRPEVVRRELLQAIGEGRPERAVQRIGALRREDVLPPGELEEILSSAVGRTRRAYREAVQQERARDALRLYGNLVAVGAEARDPELISRLHLDYATELFEAGNKPAALSAVLRAPSPSSLPDHALDLALRTAMELNNRDAASTLLELLGPRWREAHPEIVAFVDSEASPVEMSEGVVTVWVNRGLRLQNGMGVPDRVIGSGFFVDSRGYLITNYHVIASEVDPEYEGYSRLYVRLPSDPAERIPARVVGYSPMFDVALLKVEIDAPYVFSFTDVRSLEPGTSILAIGSPGGLENSISSGIISAVGRRFLQLGDAMQVDVPVNPGNSGGPLLDRSGRLVGVVFAGLEQFEGVNFAIPSFWIQGFLPDLFVDQQVVHPWMGVAVETVSDGLEVSYVANGSPADQAGIRSGDVITGLGDWSPDKIGAAQSILLRHDPGALVSVSWTRDDEAIEGLVALEPRPDSPVDVALEEDIHDRLYPVLFGMRVERTPGFSLFQTYRVTRVYRGGIADETGITPGDTFAEHGFVYDEELGVVFLRMFIQKRTEGFMRTNIQLPAYVERDNFL
ncbi:MAG: trypsin-like peptidase domain-containing protein [Spirochaetota bacterium]